MTKKEYSYINRVLQILIKYKIEKYQITYDEEGIHISLDQTMDEDIYEKNVLKIEMINISDFIESAIINKIYYI